MKIMPLSSKHQIVIPKEARKKLGISGPGNSLYIKRVTKDEIVLAKTKTTEQDLMTLLHSTPPTSSNVVAGVRKMREEWNK